MKTKLMQLVLAVGLVGGAQVASGAEFQNPNMEKLYEQIQGPGDHDRATAALGLSPRLVNMHFTSRVKTPIGEALYVPIQVSEREGGRKSVYYIYPGEEVVTGAFLIDSKTYYRSVRRDTGRGVPAQTGDQYTETILTPAGQALVVRSGALTVIQPDKGIGEVAYKTGGKCKWWAWSFYMECDTAVASNPNVSSLLAVIQGPSDHDRATQELGLEAKLYNLHFSSQVETPVGPSLYIPIQVSEREGGRKSTYFISAGEEVVTGTYVVDRAPYARAVRRDTGEAMPAQTGDWYTERIVAANQETVSLRNGQLTVLDPSKGLGEVAHTTQTCKWWAWSFYMECSTTTK